MAGFPLKTVKTYKVHSSFLTLQGEGHHRGRRAVFIRFSGCNVWNGEPKDRQRDADRHSKCALVCDTEFRGMDRTNGGGEYTARDLVIRARDLWGPEEGMFVVFTGGEPSLQLDDELVSMLHDLGEATVAVETNGTNRLPDLIDWVCLSPKPPMPVVDQDYDEVKVLYPLFDPLPYARYARLRWVSPVTDHHPISRVMIQNQTHDNLRDAVAFVMEHAGWGLSIQEHKIVGIP